MELRQLTYFTAIAQAGTITAAAQKLHMSQPPLSLQLQKLEDELGCPLFERDTRHLHLTPAGELFYERAQAILQQCADLKREMADLQAGGRGLLRIGVVSSLTVSYTHLDVYKRQVGSGVGAASTTSLKVAEESLPLMLMVAVMS